MSTISEVDIRDWDKVDFKLIEYAERRGDDVAYFTEFVEQVQLIRDKQIKAVAALLRRPE